MKKTVLCFFALILLLCGCKEQKTVDVNLKNLSMDADVKYRSYTINCTIELDGGGMFTSTINAPEAIAGTIVRYDGDMLTVSYMGLEYTPEKSPKKEHVNGIINMILGSASAGAQAERTEKGFMLKSKVANYEYELYVSEVGLPLSLECEKADLYAEFSNVKLGN